jgi:hypothetical protein
MEIINDDYNKRLRVAEEKVKRLREFYTHCIRYLIITAFLALINWYTSPHYWWVLWVLGGWGLALLFQGLSLYRNGIWGDNWEKRKIKEIMDKENK